LTRNEGGASAPDLLAVVNHYDRLFQIESFGHAKNRSGRIPQVALTPAVTSAMRMVTSLRVCITGQTFLLRVLESP
jgi:hypothetical protein